MENVSLTVYNETIANYEEIILKLKTELTEWKSEKLAEANIELNTMLKMAKQLIASKAFPNMTAEQAFVVIKAGKELGMSEIQALNDLYIVNGRIGFHSKGLIGRLTSQGCKFTYTDETKNGVLVTCYYKDEVFKQEVTDKDHLLINSKAMRIAPQNKMRFHGVRMIATFHLAHLLGSLSAWDIDDYEANNKNALKPDNFETILLEIEQCKTKEDLDNVKQNHKSISKDIELLSAFGKKKKEIEK